MASVADSRRSLLIRIRYPMPAKSSKKGHAPLLVEGLLRSADEAGLRYVSDWKRGITRKRNGKGFSYLSADGTAVRDAETLARIRSLAIRPPRDTSKRRVTTREGEGNIATIRAGGRSGTKRNTAG
jgi:hypothetical protein